MMKCPTCGGPLKPSKKDPDYLLCYTCKKKFKVPQHQAEDVAPKTESMSSYAFFISRSRLSRTSFGGILEYFCSLTERSFFTFSFLAIAIIVVAAVIVYMLLK